MKNKNIKNILDYIEKYAAKGLRDVATSTPAATPAATPSGGGSYTPSGAAGNAEIQEVVEMQNAIKALGVLVRSEPIKETKAQIGEGFSDWLAQQHVEKAKIHGKEWTHEEARIKVEEKQPTEVIQLKYVMNSLGRIGPGQREIGTDGRWGPRTQNAIRNVYAFAEALINVVSAFSIKGFSPSFTKSDLDALENAIPKQDDPRVLKVSELKQKAATATPLIKKIGDLYLSYKRQIVENPRYNTYITEKAPLFKVTKKGPPPQKTPLQQTYEQDLNKIFLDVVDFNLSTENFLRKKTVEQVPLSILQSKDSFQRFLVDKQVLNPTEATNPVLLRLALKSIVDALEYQKQSVKKKEEVKQRSLQKQVRKS